MKPKLVSRTWFKMRAENGVGTINILGDIGGFGVNFESFTRALDNLGLGAGDEIKLTINSDGGEVSQGFAIYNALAMHPAKKTVTIMGLAASMASVVAMAGDVRRMPKNAVMMIHNPIGGVSGESDEIISFGEHVGDMRENMAQTYVDASGGKLSKSKALALMAKQSWIGAAECLKLGLATEVIEPMKMSASFIRGDQVNLSRSRSPKESVMSKKTNQDDATLFEGEDNEAVTAARADERTKILATQKEVNAVCTVAGRPELAAKFNEDGKSLSEVVVELGKLGVALKPKGTNRATTAATTETEISARQRVDTGDETQPVIDTNEIYANYNNPGRITKRTMMARAN